MYYDDIITIVKWSRPIEAAVVLMVFFFSKKEFD